MVTMLLSKMEVKSSQALIEKVRTFLIFVIMIFGSIE